MSDIQRYEPWPQEWPKEDDNGDLVTYEDHRKVVEALEAKLAKAVEALEFLEIAATGSGVPHPKERELLHCCIRKARATLAEIKGEIE